MTFNTESSAPVRVKKVQDAYEAQESGSSGVPEHSETGGVSNMGDAGTPEPLGSFGIDGHCVEVTANGENCLWLSLGQEHRRQSLGVILWDANRTQHLVIDRAEAGWVRPGSRLAEQVVAEAMTLYRRSKGIPEVFSERATKPSSSPRTARGVAVVSQL